MRKLFYLALIMPLLLTSCGNNEEVERLKSERDSLARITQSNDQTINEFVSAFNEVEANLEIIKQKEKIISLKARGDVELNENSKDKINDDIHAIYDLMKKNKKTIALLQRKLKKSKNQSAGFKKMIATLKKQMLQKDQQIDKLKNDLVKLNINIQELNSEIADLNTDIDTLKQKSSEQKAVIDNQNRKLHEAYYVFGTKKELKKNKIISSKGGFIGIGGMQKLTENFNKNLFTQVDTRSFTSVPLFAKKAKLVTSHPSSSYYFAGDNKIDSLVIKNSKEFWSVSKYLVIMVD